MRSDLTGGLIPAAASKGSRLAVGFAGCGANDVDGVTLSERSSAAGEVIGRGR
jgi:hypothetical protein